MLQELNTEQLFYILREEQGKTILCKKTDKLSNRKNEYCMADYIAGTVREDSIRLEPGSRKGPGIEVHAGQDLIRIMTYLLDMRYIQLSYRTDIWEMSIF